jgi:hypothetical protein
VEKKMFPCNPFLCQEYAGCPFLPLCAQGIKRITEGGFTQEKTQWNGLD